MVSIESIGERHVLHRLTIESSREEHALRGLRNGSRKMGTHDQGHTVESRKKNTYGSRSSRVEKDMHYLGLQLGQGGMILMIQMLGITPSSRVVIEYNDSPWS